MDKNKIIQKGVRHIAEEHGCTVDEVNAILDQHPIENDRDRFLKRTLALELYKLDRLDESFSAKAFVDRDVAAGALLVKIAERRATLLGLNPPLGHAVAVIQHPPAAAQTSIDQLQVALDRTRGRLPKPDEPDDDPESPMPH